MQGDFSIWLKSIGTLFGPDAWFLAFYRGREAENMVGMAVSLINFAGTQERAAEATARLCSGKRGSFVGRALTEERRSLRLAKRACTDMGW